MRARALLPACLIGAGILLALAAATPSVPDAGTRFATARARVESVLRDARARAEAASAGMAGLADLARTDRIAAFERAREIRERHGVDGVALLDWNGDARVWAGRTFDVDPEIDCNGVRQGARTVEVLDHPAQRILYSAEPAGDGIAIAFRAFDARFPRDESLAERVAREADLGEVRFNFGQSPVLLDRKDEPRHEVAVIEGLVHATFYLPDDETLARERAAANGARVRLTLAILALTLLSVLIARSRKRLADYPMLRAVLIAVAVLGMRWFAHRLGLPAGSRFDGDPGAVAGWLPWTASGEVFLSAVALLVAVLVLAWASRATIGSRSRRALLGIAIGGSALLAFAPRFYLARIEGLVQRTDGVTLFDPLRLLPGVRATLLLAALCLLTSTLFIVVRAVQRAASRVHPLLGALPLLALLAGAFPWPGPLLALGAALAVLSLHRAGTPAERASMLALLAAAVSFPPLYAAQRHAFVEDAAEQARLRMLGAGSTGIEERLDQAVRRATDPLEGANNAIAARIARGAPTDATAFELWSAADWSMRDPCAVQVWDRDGKQLSSFDFDSPPAWWLPAPPSHPRSGSELLTGRDRGASIHFHVRDIELRTSGDDRVVGMARFSVPDPWDMLLSNRRPSMFSEPPDLIVRGAARPVLIADLGPDGTPRRASGGATADLPPLPASLLSAARDSGFASLRVEHRGEPAVLVLAAAGYDFAALVFEEDLLEQTGFAFARVLLVDTGICLLLLLVMLVAQRGRVHLLFRHRVALFLVLLSLPPVVLLAIYNRTLAQQRYDREIRERLEDRLDLAENLLRDSGQKIDDDWCTRFAAVHGLDLNAYRGSRLIATSRPGVWDTGLLSRRLDAGPMVQLLLRGRTDYTGRAPFAGNSELRAAYRMVTLPQEDGPLILAAPALEDRRELERGAAQSGALLLAGYLVAAILTVFAGLLLARRLTRPLQSLRDATARVGAGELEARLPESRADEFGELMRAFNRMTLELAEAQELRVRAEKAAAWREMARQIAHDVKNPLTPIKLTIQNLLAAHEEDPERFERQFEPGSRLILAQIDALHRIAGQFSAYARLPAGEPRPFDLRALVGEVGGLYAAAGDAEVRVTLPPGDAPVTIQGDRDELRRALVNIVSNSQQAKAARIELVLECDERRVVVEVRDDGSGMAPGMLDRVFEPAFTTRTSGTGLGLPIVKRIVDDHAGSITIRSEVGGGTVVRIELPRRRASS